MNKKANVIVEKIKEKLVKDDFADVLIYKNDFGDTKNPSSTESLRGYKSMKYLCDMIDGCYMDFPYEKMSDEDIEKGCAFFLNYFEKKTEEALGLLECKKEDFVIVMKYTNIGYDMHRDSGPYLYVTCDIYPKFAYKNGKKVEIFSKQIEKSYFVKWCRHEEVK